MSTSILTITKPAGSNGELQFNDNGKFGADSSLFWDNVNKRLGLNQSSPLGQFHITPTSSLSSHIAFKVGTVEVRGDGRLIPNKGISSSTFIGDTDASSALNTVAIGFLAGDSLGGSSSNNTLVGYRAGRLTTSVNNSAYGQDSLRNNTDGFQQTAIGCQSFQLLGTGSNNTALGFRAGAYIGTGTTALTSADNSLFLGNQARANGNGQINQIVIGYNTVGLGSNTTRIGNNDTVLTNLDGELKIDDVNTDDSLTEILVSDVNNVVHKTSKANLLKEVKYVASFNTIDQVVSLLDFAYTINTVTLSSTISSYEVSINGGAFSVPTLPLSVNANDYLIFKVTFASGEDKGALLINGIKN
jgi:hypothetical protein